MTVPPGVEATLGVVEVAHRGQQLAIGGPQAATQRVSFQVEVRFEATALGALQADGAARRVVLEGEAMAVVVPFAPPFSS